MLARYARLNFTAPLLCLAAHVLAAQQHLTVPRADGKSTPLMVYRAGNGASGCAPLAVISHGAGGSENGYQYLAEGMAGLGYTAVVMGHAESGLAALRGDMVRDGIKPGVTDLVSDPTAESDRLLDVSAALKWADGQCHAPFRVLLGHSMGSTTVMLEAGAQNMIGVPAPPAGQDRFDAYVALSPEGSGIVFPANAWHGIRKPLLIMTGTRDQGLKGGPQARLEPWRNLPGTSSHCQWQGVIDGATHMNFAGVGIGAGKVEPMVTETVASFLAGARGKECRQPAAVDGMELKAK
jgi:predicted dienelactone hydrolase